jgi:hypothetical protein
MKYLMVLRRSLALLLLIIGAVVCSLLPPDVSSSLGLKGAFFVGLFLPAFILGAAWGWAALSRVQWAWATGILAISTLAFAVTHHDGLLNAYQGLDKQRAAEATIPVPDTSSPWRK